MMKITYIEPDIPESQRIKAAKLVRQMTELVEKFTTGQCMKVTTLTEPLRKGLLEAGYAPILVNNLVLINEHIVEYERVKTEEEKWGEDKWISTTKRMVGFTSNAFLSDLYSSNAIRKALMTSHVGRCAFCETLINQTAYGDVEHFRPKAGYTENSNTLWRPGYFFLAYHPRNLLLSCTLCNQAYKQNSFPVIGKRARGLDFDDELALLVDPYREDPRRYIRFNPINGKAYPFDLVEAFYAQTQSWGPNEIQQNIWQNPRLIPGMKTSEEKVDQNYNEWLKQVKEPTLRKGQSTIAILGLNREGLCRARLSQLRQLRGLFWTANMPGPSSDQEAAQSLLEKLASGNPETAPMAPQYLSCSVDGVNTWKVSGSTEKPWLKNYNVDIGTVGSKTLPEDPLPGNDSMMYFVPSNWAKVNNKRYIVYLSSDTKIYGNYEGGKGWYLTIDWNNDSANKVCVLKDEKLCREITIGDLLTGNQRTVYNLFKNYKVLAIGDYLPMKF